MKGRFNDLTGKKFSRLTVLSRIKKPGDKRTFWLCLCDCGNEVVVRADRLTSGTTKSCRCLNDENAANLGKNNFIDLSGRRYGRLLVIAQSEKTHYGNYMWLCKCDCGNEKVVAGNSLCSGNTKSCGCLRKENTTQMKTSHNLSKTRIYSIWGKMVRRCTNAKDRNYLNYGGRGISICDDWRFNFVSFYDWSMNNGYRDDLSIDRINNDGNYEPDNCRWTTMLVQENNRRSNHYITHNGETHTVTEWDRLIGDGTGFIKRRLYKGWSIEEAATIPKGGCRK